MCREEQKPATHSTKVSHKPFELCVDLNDRRHRRATMLAKENVRKWAANQWNDLGMFSLTFYAYVNKEQKLTMAM
jgi:hypothetical protein